MPWASIHRSLTRKEHRWLWFFGLLGLLALRGLALAEDPLLVSPSGMVLTDEGWYTKASRNLFLWGRSEAEHDFVPLTHTFGFSAFALGVFHIFGLNLFALRAVGLVVSILSVGWLASAVANRWGVLYGRLCALGLASNVLLVALTRMALPDPLGFAVFCIALALFLHSKMHATLEWPCAFFASAACVIKLSFAPVTFWLGALLWTRNWSGGRPWRGLLLGLFTLGLSTGSYLLIHGANPEAWARFARLNVQGRMVNNPLEWLANLGYAIGADLWSTGALGLGVFIAFHARARFKQYWSTLECRALVALLALGFLARSLIWYHPPRYGLVTALCIILLSLLAFRQAASAPSPNVARLTRDWILALALGQLPQLGALGLHGFSQDSMRSCTATIHGVMEQDSQHPRLLYGTGSASFVALTHPTLKAVDIADGVQDPCDPIDRYGPGYVLLDDRKEAQFNLRSKIQGCFPDLQLEPLHSELVLNNYYRQGPWTLYKLTGSLHRAGTPAQ